MSSKRDLATFNCSLAQTLALVGNDWSLMILRDAFLGLRRFSEFHKSLGIARNVLAERLDALVRAGLLDRKGSETRPIYQMTSKGHDLVPALVALMQWGDRWLSRGKPPMVLGDKDGRPIQPLALVTEDGPLSPGEIIITAGPGADTRTRAFLSPSADAPERKRG